MSAQALHQIISLLGTQRHLFVSAIPQKNLRDKFDFHSNCFKQFLLDCINSGQANLSKSKQIEKYTKTSNKKLIFGDLQDLRRIVKETTQQNNEVETNQEQAETNKDEGSTQGKKEANEAMEISYGQFQDQTETTTNIFLLEETLDEKVENMVESLAPVKKILYSKESSPAEKTTETGDETARLNLDDQAQVELFLKKLEKEKNQQDLHNYSEGELTAQGLGVLDLNDFEIEIEKEPKIPVKPDIKKEVKKEPQRNKKKISGKIKCDKCGITFATVIRLNKHVRFGCPNN